MLMTPKKILSLPVYGSGTTLGLIAAILLLPGGLIMAFALGCYWLADKLSTEEEIGYRCDMTIEEYEEGFHTDRTCSNCRYGDACLTALDDWCPDWWEDLD